MAKYHAVYMAITHDYMRRINDKKRSNIDQLSSIIESSFVKQYYMLLLGLVWIFAATQSVLSTKPVW